MLPKMFANPTHAIALGILIQANARTTVAAATGAATGLISRNVAIQTDVPSSSPRTQTLIVSVLVVLVTIVGVTQNKTNVTKQAVSGTQCLEAAAIVTSRALMRIPSTPKMNARRAVALTATASAVTCPTTSTLKLPLKATTRMRSCCGQLPKSKTSHDVMILVI